MYNRILKQSATTTIITQNLLCS